jgi:hypothetical protein
MLAIAAPRKIEAADLDLHRSLPLLRSFKILSDSFRPQFRNEQVFLQLQAGVAFLLAAQIGGRL